MSNQPYEQQGHPYQQPYEQQGQPYQPSYEQQGHAYQQPYDEQAQAYGQSYEQSYGRQGQPYQQPYEQQGHAYQQPYDQQGQPDGSPHPPHTAPASHAPASASAMPAQSSPAAATAWAEAPPAPDAPGAARAPASASAPEPTAGTPQADPAQPRLTAAQRARAEGRSPIIEPGPLPAALTAVLALLLAGAAAVGSYALLVPLVVLQAVTAAGWFRLNGMWPARQGIALAFLGALVADGALLAADRGKAPAVLLAAGGIWLLLALALQLRSRADADERITGLMATVVSAALAIAAAGHLAAEPDAVTVAGCALAAALLARAVPVPTALSVLVALAAAAAAGAGTAQVTDYGTREGVLLGLGAGVCALIGHRVAGYDYPSRFVHMTAGVALPLTAAAPAVYLLGRALA